MEVDGEQTSTDGQHEENPNRTYIEISGKRVLDKVKVVFPTKKQLKCKTSRDWTKEPTPKVDSDWAVGSSKVKDKDSGSTDQTSNNQGSCNQWGNDDPHRFTRTLEKHSTHISRAKKRELYIHISSCTAEWVPKKLKEREVSRF